MPRSTEALTEVARRGALYPDAIEHGQLAVKTYEQLGDAPGTRHATELFGRILTEAGRPVEAIAVLAQAGVTAGESHAAEAPLTAALARAHLMADDATAAAAVAELAIARAERDDDIASLVDGLTTRGTALGVLGRRSEGIAIIRAAVDLELRRNS